MSNAELSDILAQTANLMDIKGEDSFRVNAYRRAARTIGDLTQEAAELHAAGKLAEVPGIGKTLLGHIEAYLKSGQVPLHQELLGSVPKGLPGLLDIPGMGPKKVALVWKELGVENLDDLARAIDKGKLAHIKGMGAKTVEQIRHGIEFVRRASGRTPLGLAWDLAAEIVEALRGDRDVTRVDVAGSLRRASETVGDLDFVCASNKGSAVIERFTKLPHVVRVTASGETKGSVVLHRRDGFEIAAQLRVVPPASYGAALQYFTGSKEHNVRLRELAGKKGWKLNEWGLFDSDKPIAGEDEAGIYRKLGLALFPPEVREDRGEFDVGREMPRLIERKDIRGDLHMHTIASDGTLTAEAMAAAAHALHYEYIAITDHSKSSAIANGLSIDRMWRQIEKIRQLNDNHDTLSVLVGCECDILPDGSLDYPDAILAACDFVVASVHSGLRGSRDAMTKRVIRAMENTFITAIGHPTGRLLNKREPMDLDIPAVIAAAARTETALELNCSWQRLDLCDRHVRMARDAGVMIVIDTDAHSALQLEQMEFGVRTARRGWLRPEDVLNTRPLAAVKRWIARKRKGAHK